MTDQDKSFFAKLILASVAFIAFLTVLGLTAEEVKNKKVVNREPEASTSPIAVENKYFGNEYIQVKTPQKNTAIKSPVSISGKANVFEGNVRVKIKDKNENILADTFITASGAYDKLYPFEKEVSYGSSTSQDGIVEIFAEDMKDGGDGEINKVIIPVIFEDYADISDWQTYSDKKYGFEIKYPAGWKNTGDVMSVYFINTFIKNSHNFSCSFGILAIPTNNFDNYAPSNYNNREYIKHPDGKDFSFNFTSEITESLINNNGIRYSVDFKDFECSKIFDQMRSTFKFTKNNKTEKVKLYYYNKNYDPKFDCLAEAVMPVEREILITQTSIKNTIELLIKGEITEQEKLAGFSSEFPHAGFNLLSVDLKNGILTLKFPEVPSFTSGGSCRIGLLSNQIVKTAKQFPEVKQVIFDPVEIFQP